MHLHFDGFIDGAVIDDGRLISAVPSTSTGLVYGRAALLGYTAGEDRCDGAYPKCPRNEVRMKNVITEVNCNYFACCLFRTIYCTI